VTHDGAPGRPAPGGSIELRFDFGGVVVAFESASRPWRQALAARFGGFETNDAPAFRILQRTTPTASDAAAGPWPAALTAGPAPGRFEMRGAGFVATVDLAGAAAEIRGPAAAYPVDILLPELLPLLAPTGLVLHCALLSDGARAWVCSGPSGCGKSTLASLLPERALCDELALVAATGGAFSARALPFWDARPGGAPLAAVVLLRHGDAHRLRPMPAERAFGALAREIRWPGGDHTALARAFSTLGDLVEQVPAFELEFLPRADVWNAIAEAA
jgi:hypothetical protein